MRLAAEISLESRPPPPPPPPRAAAAALQHRPVAEAHRCARLRADDTVGHQAVPALPALDRRLRGRAEHAVGRHAHPALEGADAAGAVSAVGPAGMAAAPGRAAVPALEDRSRAEAHRGARLRARDAVRHEAMAALPALEGALGGGPEDAVRRNAHLPLESADVTALARGARLDLRACDRRHAHRHHAAGQRKRDNDGNSLPLHSSKPSVGFRLRGELTGSRLALRPGNGRGDSPQRPEGRIGSPVRPTRRRGDSALGRPSFYQAKFLQVARFVAECARGTNRAGNSALESGSSEPRH